MSTLSDHVTSNMDHSNYENLNEEDKQKVSKIAEDYAKRVVKITWYIPGERVPCGGSGVVFKAGGKLFLQTCYHVIKDTTHFAVICEDPVIDQKLITAYGGKCALQDKAIYELESTPAYNSSAYHDYSEILVNVMCGRKPQHCLVEFHRQEQCFVIHIFTTRAFRRERLWVTFNDKKKHEYLKSDLCYCSNTGCCLLFLKDDDVPAATKNMFMQERTWENHISEPVVVTISHPDGGERTITMGDIRAMTIENKKRHKSQKVCFKEDSHHSKIRKIKYTVDQIREIPWKPIEKEEGHKHVLFSQKDEKKEVEKYLKRRKGNIEYHHKRDNKMAMTLELTNNANSDFKVIENDKTKHFYTTDVTNNNVKIVHAELTGTKEHESIQDNGSIRHRKSRNVLYLLHDAKTANGSSGGCVLVIGKKDGKFKTLIGMHTGTVNTCPAGIAIVSCLRRTDDNTIPKS